MLRIARSFALLLPLAACRQANQDAQLSDDQGKANESHQYLSYTERTFSAPVTGEFYDSEKKRPFDAKTVTIKFSDTGMKSSGSHQKLGVSIAVYDTAGKVRFRDSISFNPDVLEGQSYSPQPYRKDGDGYDHTVEYKNGRLIYRTKRDIDHNYFDREINDRIEISVDKKLEAVKRVAFTRSDSRGWSTANGSLVSNGTITSDGPTTTFAGTGEPTVR